MKSSPLCIAGFLFAFCFFQIFFIGIEAEETVGKAKRVSPALPSELTRIKYSESCPFNQKIPRNPEIDPNSETMAKSLEEVARNAGIVLSVTAWTLPVYYADETTPRYDVTVTADWAQETRKLMQNVPIPDFAVPDPEDDGSMAVIDLSRNCEFDFWQPKKKNGRWSASWVNCIRTDGNGVYPHGLSARGSGFALLAGVIWPEELIGKKIDHALLFSYDHTKAGGPVSPATESDGQSRRIDAIPEGARIQLDPSLDLEKLNLSPYEKTIAKAMQEYGMILGDSGGGIQLYVINPICLNKNPYEGIFPKFDPIEGFVPLEKIPPDKFRILKLGEQTDRENQLTPCDCGSKQ